MGDGTPTMDEAGLRLERPAATPLEPLERNAAAMEAERWNTEPEEQRRLGRDIYRIRWHRAQLARWCRAPTRTQKTTSWPTTLQDQAGDKVDGQGHWERTMVEFIQEVCG